MIRGKTWSLVVAASLAVACGSNSTKQPATTPTDPTPEAPALVTPSEPALPEIPSSPVAAPASVIATAQIGDPSAVVASLAAFANEVQPGAGMMVTLDAVVAAAASEGIDLRGADLTKPIRVLVLNPVRFHAPMVAVVTVGDQAALTDAAEQHGMRVQLHGGLAAIGSYEALTEASAYALTTLATATTAPNLVVDVDVKTVMATYGSQLQSLAAMVSQNADPTQREMIDVSMQMYFSMFQQLDRVQMSLDLVAGHASVTSRIHALPGTTLAAFVGMQVPAKFTLLEQVASGPMIMGGFLDLAQVWSSMGALVEPMMAQTYGDAAPTVMKFWKQWIGLKTGETALSIDMIGAGKFGLSGLWEMDDPALASKMLNDYFATLAKTPIGFMSAKLKTSTYKGVKLSMVTMAPGKGMPADQAELYQKMGGSLVGGFGVAGKQLFFSLGDNAAGRAKALADQVKAGKKKPAPAGFATVLADARARNESYLMAFDLAALKAIFAPVDTDAPAGPKPAPPAPLALEPGAFGIGVADGALTMRLTIPAVQVKSLAGF